MTQREEQWNGNKSAESGEGIIHTIGEENKMSDRLDI